MLNNKILAALVVATMMIVAFPLVSAYDENEAALGTTTGQYTVFYYDSTTESWNHANASAYDAALAVKMSGFWSPGDSMVEKSTGGTYPTPNHDYGDITTFKGITEAENKVWNVLVYQGNAWSVGSPYLGWYTCFSDQPSAWQTANIALYYGSSVPDNTLTSLQAYITANNVALSGTVSVQNSNFQFTFYLKINVADVEPTIVSSGNVTNITASNLFDGITVTAYGSNAYLALKWAFGFDSGTGNGNVSGEESIPGTYNSSYQYWTYNGWLNSLFGLSTTQIDGKDTPNDWTDDTYAYWVIYDRHLGLGDQTNHKADFVIGQYTPVSGAPNADNTIALIFEITGVE